MTALGAGLRHRRAVLLGGLTAVAAALTACGGSQQPDPLAGIPRALVLEARPIGRGARFHPPGRGSGPRALLDVALGARFGVHVELFAVNRVVLIAQGIGTRAPRTFSAGRISGAACYGELVTIDPTGLILVRPGARVTVSDLFRSWGEPLSAHRLASFPAPAAGQVAVFINGRRSTRPVGQVPLTRHAEIVLEVGPPRPAPLQL